MALDRIYSFQPDGAAAGAVDVWAQHDFQSGLASVAEAIDSGGVFYQPRSTIVIRIRWRRDLVAGVSRFVDSDGRLWRVGETLEVGRRHWLDVVVATYDIDEDDTPETGFIPPAGWYLQRRNGADKFATSDSYIRRLVVRATVESGNPGMRHFDVAIPSPGWAVARGLAQWIGGSGFTGQVIPATAPGSTLTGFYVSPEAARAVDTNNFDAGTSFPSFTDGVFVAQGSGFAVPSLAPGTVITIAGA